MDQRVPNQIPSAVVFCQNPLMGVLDNFFPTGTYTGIGTSVSSLKIVMKRTTKKKKIVLRTFLVPN